MLHCAFIGIVSFLNEPELRFIFNFINKHLSCHSQHPRKDIYSIIRWNGNSYTIFFFNLQIITCALMNKNNPLASAFIFIDQAVKQSVLGPLIASKMMGIVVLITILKIFRIGAMPQKHKYPVVCLTGLFDAAGTAFYASAAHVGRLDISAVLASMHPAITAFLAWVVLKERLSRPQWFGVVAALIALALIAG